MRLFINIFQIVNVFSLLSGIVFVDAMLDLYRLDLAINFPLFWFLFFSTPLQILASFIVTINFWRISALNYRVWLIITVLANIIGWPLFILAAAFGPGHAVVYTPQVGPAVLYIAVVLNNILFYHRCLGILKKKELSEWGLLGE